MLRMEIALFLVAFVAYMYFTAEKEHTALRKTFSVLLLVVVLVHLALDGCTVYTVNHLDTVSMLLNGTLHRLFLGSMAAVIYLFYQYIAILVQEETGRPRQLDWPAKAFLVLAELGNFLLPISYTVTAEGNYSAGLTCWFPMPPWPFTCCCAPDFGIGVQLSFVTHITSLSSLTLSGLMNGGILRELLFSCLLQTIFRFPHRKGRFPCRISPAYPSVC